MSSRVSRVAFLTTSFPLRKGSSSGVFVQRLVKNLPSYLDVTVLTPADVSSERPTVEPGYRIHCFRYAPWKWQVLAHQPGGIPVALKHNKGIRWLVPVFLCSMFVECLRLASRVDIIHANWSINGAIAGVVGKLLRKPVVTTLRGEDVTRAKDSLLYRWLLALCLRSNRKLVAVSKAIADQLMKDYPHFQEKIAFLPNGIDSELLERSRSIEGKETDKPFKIVTVGSLIPRKGIDVIINAFLYLADRQNFHLTIIGAGQELESLEALVEHNMLSEQVEFIGSVSPEKVAEYLSVADAFILASYSEGRPNVILESFGVGLPVIASDIDGVRELVEEGKTGFRFEPGNSRELAKQIEMLERDPEVQMRFSRNGREFIRENMLLWTNVGQRYANLYQEAIEHKTDVCAD